MPTCVTLAAVSQLRNASSSRLTVRNVRTSLRARAPAAPISRQATTVSWCTSSPQHRSIIACIRASLPQKATVTPQVSSRHCHTCSPFPGATKNSTSMQRGPDCLSGSNATQNASASTRSPIGNSDKPARAATIFNHNGARPAQPGCLAARPFYSLPQALYLPDKLLCVLGRISVVLILSAQYVVVRKYVL